MTIASGIAMPSCIATLSTVAMRSLPAPARIAAVAREQRRAGHFAAAGNDQDPALGLLVAVDDRRQRMLVERASVERVRVTACPPSRRAPRSWARPRLRAARHSSTGSSVGHAHALRVRLELVRGDAAIEHLGLLVDAEDRRLVELLEDVAEAQHDDLVADDQHAPVAIMQVDGVEHRAQAQDHVGPALAAGRAMIEFAEPAAVRGFLGKALADAERGQPVEDPELALAQALVDDGPRRAAGKRALLADDLGGLPGADIGRGQDRSRAARRAAKPRTSARRLRLLHAELGQGHVDVAHVDVDLVRARSRRRRRARHCPGSARAAPATSRSGQFCRISRSS